MHVCRVKIALPLTNCFDCTKTNSMKYFENWILLRIHVCSKNTQHYLKRMQANLETTTSTNSTCSEEAWDLTEKKQEIEVTIPVKKKSGETVKPRSSILFHRWFLRQATGWSCNKWLCGLYIFLNSNGQQTWTRCFYSWKMQKQMSITKSSSAPARRAAAPTFVFDQISFVVSNDDWLMLLLLLRKK